MGNHESLKSLLHKACQIFIDDKVAVITSALETVKEGMLKETKSTAGDKFETTRAHLQQEQSNLNKQLAEVNTLQTILNRAKLEVNSDKINLGSLVFTSKANYYISIPAGKMKANGIDFYAISPASPIAQLLLNKSVQDEVVFNKTAIKIKEIY